MARDIVISDGVGSILTVTSFHPTSVLEVKPTAVDWEKLYSITLNGEYLFVVRKESTCWRRDGTDEILTTP